MQSPHIAENPIDQLQVKSGLEGLPEVSADEMPRSPREPTVAESKWAYLQVLGAFCLNLNTWGIMNSYGAFQEYYSVHLLHENSASAISWIGSTQAFLMFLLSFFIGPIFDAGYLRSLLYTGSFLSVVGFFMTSLCMQYWQIFLAQGVMMGLGFGCLYLPAPALVSMHFEQHQSLAMGLSSIGSSIGGIVFPVMFTQLQSRIGYGWTTRALSFVLLATSCIPLITMRYPKPPSDSSMPEASVDADNAQHDSSILIRKKKLVDVLVDRSGLQDWPYVLCNTGLLTGFMAFYVVLYYINLLSLDLHLTDSRLASSMLLILNAASIIGRIGPPVLADRFGPSLVLCWTALIAAVVAFCVLAVDSAPGIIVWSIAFGIASGAFMGLPAAAVGSLSSTNARIGARLGMTLGIVGCGVLIAGPIAGAILGGSGGWTGLVSWCGALLIAATLSMGAARVTKSGLTLQSIV